MRLTEQRWLKTREPGLLLRHLRGQLSHRKMRLLLVAYWRWRWTNHPDDTRSQSPAYQQNRLEACSRAEQLADQGGIPDDPDRTELRFYIMEPNHLLEDYLEHTCAPISDHDAAETLVRLIHEVVGNPFRPLALQHYGRHETGTFDYLAGNPCGSSHHGYTVLPHALLEWHDGLVLKTAQWIYAEKNWEDLPVLADMLEEAGCVHTELLAHLRNGKEHVRGCWALDLLAGKEPL